jgi:hypothetical protein
LYVIKAYRWCNCKTIVFKLDIIWNWEVNFTLWPLFLRGKSPDTHKIGRWMKLWPTRSEVHPNFSAREKNPLSLWYSKTGNVYLVAGLLLNGLSRLSSACTYASLNVAINFHAHAQEFFLSYKDNFNVLNLKNGDREVKLIM